MSRNKDRLGTSTPEPDTLPPQALNTEEPAGFSFVVPTEFVELPSGGQYYTDGHPLCGEESIEVKQMTAKEEDMLTSRTLLKKGIALDRVLESVIRNKKIDPDSLLVGDKNAIIIATRVSGYGSDYTTQVTCPQCGSPQEYTFDLNDANVYNGNVDEALGVTDHENGTFTTQLPKTGINVTFRLLTSRDERWMVDTMENARKRKRPEQPVTLQLQAMIVAVNGNNTEDAISYIIENIPSADARHLRFVYKTVAPNIDLTQHFECSECTHEQTMEVPLTADFFWPDR